MPNEHLIPSVEADLAAAKDRYAEFERRRDFSLKALAMSNEAAISEVGRVAHLEDTLHYYRTGEKRDTVEAAKQAEMDRWSNITGWSVEITTTVNRLDDLAVGGESRATPA